MIIDHPEPIRVLIVDDHPIVRHGLGNLLAGHPDLEVVGSAENGAEALLHLGREETDVILLDVKMEGQSGIEVARRIRQSYPEVKIIILTTYDDESYVHQALEAGVHGYLLKSVSHRTLPDAIRAVFSGEKLLSPELVSDVVTKYQELAREQARQAVGLTATDLKLLQAISEGASNKQMAERFYLSEATVKRRVQEILEKLGAGNRAQAIAEAVRQGWI
jgi:DNA-binding NarL/FixJ family response regulator